jgi:hypothetical protein
MKDFRILKANMTSSLTTLSQGMLDSAQDSAQAVQTEYDGLYPKTCSLVDVRYFLLFRDVFPYV